MTYPMIVMNGGMMDQHEADEQERRACADIAAGLESALTHLSPMHHRRDEYLAMLADFRRAAGQHCDRHLVRAG